MADGPWLDFGGTSVAEADGPWMDFNEPGPSHGASGGWSDNEAASSFLRPEPGLSFQSPSFAVTPPNRMFGPTPEEQAAEQERKLKEAADLTAREEEAVRGLDNANMRAAIHADFSRQRQELGIGEITMPPGQLPEVTAQDLQTLGLPGGVARPLAGVQQGIARLASGIVGSPEGALFLAAPQALPPLLAAITPQMATEGAAQLGQGLGEMYGGGDVEAGLAKTIQGVGMSAPAVAPGLVPRAARDIREIISQRKALLEPQTPTKEVPSAPIQRPITESSVIEHPPLEERGLSTTPERGNRLEQGWTVPEAPKEVAATPEAVRSKYPGYFEELANDPTQVPVEIQKPDGTSYPAVVNGFYGEGIPSVGTKINTGWTHGMLLKGDTIVTKLPSMEEFKVMRNEYLGGSKSTGTQRIQEKLAAAEKREVATKPATKPAETPATPVLATPALETKAPAKPQSKVEANKEFDALARNHAIEQEHILNPAEFPAGVLTGDSGSISQKILHSKQTQKAREFVFKAIGEPNASTADRARLLPKLKAYLENQKLAGAQTEIPAGVSTEFLPPEPVQPIAPVPKLGAMEKGTGDLFKGQTEDFALTGEKAPDVERMASEKAKAARDKAEAAAIVAKQQGDLLNAPAPKWTSATAGQTLKQLREGGAGERAAVNVGAIADAVYDLARRSGEGVKRAVSGLNEIRREALTLPAHSDMRRDVMNWSAKLQRSFSEADAAQKEITAKVRDPIRREGITNWIQAGGDALQLAQRRADTLAWRDPQTGRPHPQARRLVKGYDAALSLTPEELTVAGDVKAAFDHLGQRGQAEGVLNSFLDNYVTQVWDLKKGPQFAGARTLRDKFRFSKARTFDSYFSGEQAGFIPKTKDIAKLLPVYIHEMNQVLAARQLVADMSQGVASDGRPLVAPRGIEIPTDEPGAPGLVLPRAPKVADTGDYKVLEGHPALSGWRWLSKDEAGKTRFIKSDLALHPEAFRRMRAALGKSAIREWYSSTGNSLASDIPKALARGLDNFQAETKRSMLGLIAPFHQVQEGTHAVGHRVNPFFNIPKVDLVNDAHQYDAAQHGLMLQPDRASQQQFMQGSTTAGGLIGKIPGIGKVAEHYSDYLFHQYIPGLKFKTYEAILKRNNHVYADDLTSGKVSASDVKILSAQQANAAYGHLNYADLGRNPTMQHIAQLGLLAPDFLEARARFAGQSIKGLSGGKVGREQLLALGTLALAQATTAWTSAQLSGGEWDPKHPFEFRLGNRKYTMRSVPEDMAGLMSDWRSFVNSRLSPVGGKAGLELITGRDWAGRRITAAQSARQAATQFIPLNLRGLDWVKDFMGETYPNRLSTLEQLAGSVGLRVSRYTEPRIIELGRLREWIETTSGRARSVPQGKRAQFIQDQLQEVAPEYRQRAFEEIRRRGVMRGE